MSSGSLTPQVKRPGRETDRSPQSGAELKNALNIVKHRENFTLYFTHLFPRVRSGDKFKQKKNVLMITLMSTIEGVSQSRRRWFESRRIPWRSEWSYVPAFRSLPQEHAI
jgi:hypothetical protein